MLLDTAVDISLLNKKSEKVKKFDNENKFYAAFQNT